MKSYRVRYERDEAGWWVASITEIRGCHTQGRTIEQARRRVRQALRLFVNDAEKANLIDDVRLPTAIKSIVNRHQVARKQFEQTRTQTQSLTAEAVRVLTQDLRLSVRDAGDVLGLSHQRVQQLVEMQRGKGWQ